MNTGNATSEDGLGTEILNRTAKVRRKIVSINLEKAAFCGVCKADKLAMRAWIRLLLFILVSCDQATSITVVNEIYRQRVLA